MVRRVPVLEVELRADIESEEYVSSASLYSTVRPYLPNFTVKSFGGSVGCSHGSNGISDNNNIVQAPSDGASNPCTSGDTVGAFYLGFAGPNDDPSGAQSQPSPVDPGQGIIGLQG